jgi:hypothetical protein
MTQLNVLNRLKLMTLVSLLYYTRDAKAWICTEFTSGRRLGFEGKQRPKFKNNGGQLFYFGLEQFADFAVAEVDEGKRTAGRAR